MATTFLCSYPLRLYIYAHKAKLEFTVSKILGSKSSNSNCELNSSHIINPFENNIHYTQSSLLKMKNNWFNDSIDLNKLKNSNYENNEAIVIVNKFSDNWDIQKATEMVRLKLNNSNLNFQTNKHLDQNYEFINCENKFKHLIATKDKCNFKNHTFIKQNNIILNKNNREKIDDKNDDEYDDDDDLLSLDIRFDEFYLNKYCKTTSDNDDNYKHYQNELFDSQKSNVQNKLDLNICFTNNQYTCIENKNIKNKIENVV